MECIIVLGMHRSGTSALSGVLSHAGVFFGRNLLKELPENPKGFFENTEVVNFNEAILSREGVSWHNPYNLKALNDLQSDIRDLKDLLHSNYSESKKQNWIPFT